MSVTIQDPISKSAPWPASDEIVTDAVRGRILHGVYATTQPLPDEAQLAAELGLPEEAVSTALGALTNEGTVCAVPGHGTFLARLPRLESPECAAERVETILRARLEHGVYPARTWFPPQSKLLDEFGVSLYVLLNVVAKLVDSGLLSAVTSRGRFVLDPRTPAAVPIHRAETGKAELERDVRAGIKDGTFPLFSRIPSRQQLGDKYGVSAYDVKVALQPLVDEGLLRPHGSRGTYVSDPTPPGS